MNANKNEEWRLEYRCRRCGNVDRTTGTTESEAKSAIVHLMAGGASTHGLAIRAEGYHICPDGGFGVADLIGAAPAWPRHAPRAGVARSERLDSLPIHIRGFGEARTLCGTPVVAGMRLTPVAGCDEGATCEKCLEKF